jgi:hypothetical protein
MVFWHATPFSSVDIYQVSEELVASIFRVKKTPHEV